jgi:hypothetical protein
LFAQDFELIRQLGKTMGRRQAGIEMFRFQNVNRDGGFLRGFMRIRVSGRKASVLTGKLFGQEPYKISAAILQR